MEKNENNKEYLTHLAHYDNLTSLPNCIFFNESLNKALSHAKRQQKILAILSIDVDYINTDLTQEDQAFILKEIGQRLSKTLRSEDVLAKLEGNAFIILLNDIAKAKFAASVAEKILSACQSSIMLDEQKIEIKTSIGICVFPEDGESLEDLLKNVDSALYKAKQTTESSYQFFTSVIDDEARQFIQIETALRKAISNNELKLYYQPKLNIKTGTITGVEALLRWEHPELGMLTPDKFISIAEDTGLIMQIGEWALYEACKTNKYWQDEGYEHLTMGINLSPKQFFHPEIAKTINTILSKTGLRPHYLELEINEATVMSDVNLSKKILDQINETGVQLSVDHFGTGYTSISHLKQFYMSVLKIDASFVKGIPQRPDDLAIINAFIALAHNLGLKVVAEGVETAEQVEYLSQQNCDMVQGYFLSHPLPAPKVILQFKKLMDSVLL